MEALLRGRRGGGGGTWGGMQPLCSSWAQPEGTLLEMTGQNFELKKTRHYGLRNCIYMPNHVNNARAPGNSISGQLYML